MTDLPALDARALGPGVRSRFIDGINGLRMHILEAGFESRGRPLLLLLHGFPELAYSWRRVLGPLAAAGYHVVAPDQRGYGRTTGWSDAYDQDLRPFGMLSLTRDALALAFAMGHAQVAAVIGHDFGAAVASWCAMTRPDVFQRCAIMSAPFTGPPALPFDTDGGRATNSEQSRAGADLDQALAALPVPRKHYQRYYATRAANTDMMNCPQGIADFLRAYFHHKSADWPQNKPEPLRNWSAAEIGRMPTYYIMNRPETMAETVRPHMPSPIEIAACKWLTPAEMAIYAGEFARTGFQGGLNWYRARYEADVISELKLFSGRTIDVPGLFLAGMADWGTYQVPGAFETMQKKTFTRMTGTHLIPGAGHWVQQEQPEKVVTALIDFCKS